MSRREILIVKLGALGDVLRTTPLLRRLKGRITWVTKTEAFPLLRGNPLIARLADHRAPGEALKRTFDLIINFDEDDDACRIATRARAHRRVGPAFYDGIKSYCEASAPWFDMSLISRLGRVAADRLKRLGRRSYQDYLFRACGLEFRGEEYILPSSTRRTTESRIALEPTTGRTWPAKRWHGFEELNHALSAEGRRPYILRRRRSLRDYVADVADSRVVVAGDTLAMHLGLALRRKVVAIFNCTSPHEIFDYGRLTKLVHPKLDEYFYRRDECSPTVDGVRVTSALKAVRAALDR